jgi:ABC-type phosphate transport system substrate-binding protein
MKRSIVGRLCLIVFALVALGAVNAGSAGAVGALCLKVDTGQVGLYSEGCTTDVGLSGEYILAKLTMEVHPKLYCAHTDAGNPGDYETLEECVKAEGSGVHGKGEFIRVLDEDTDLITNCASITASGSSLQNLAQKTVWAPEWESGGFTSVFESLECLNTAKIAYEPTSSGKGLGEWGSKNEVLTPSESFNKEKLDEFVGTDVGPEGPSTTAGTQINLMDMAGGDKGGTLNGVVAFPIAQSAVAVIVSLPVGCSIGSDPLVKNGALSTAWFTGAVNFLTLVDSAGVAPTGSSCDNNALLQARSAGSGTTAGFKRYLGDLNLSLWDSCVLTAVNSESASCWGNVTPDETGNETGGQLAMKVYLTPGTIGYADLSDARAQGFPAPGTVEEHTVGTEKFLSFIALVPNKGAEAGNEGTAQNPEITATTNHEGANCEKATYPEPAEVANNVDWSGAKQSNATAGTAGVYPICTLTFDVAWHKYSLVEWENASTKAKEKYTKEQYLTTFDYLRWVISEGQEGSAATKLAEHHFLALPSALVTEDKAGVNMKNIFFEASGK